MIKTNNSFLFEGDHKLDQSDSHPNLHNEVNSNESGHSLVNETTPHGISNITRSNVTTKETTQNHQQNIGKTKNHSLIR